MFDPIWMEIVQWRRKFICFLWKCKSWTVSSKLLLFENRSLDELNTTYLWVYLVVIQGNIEDFFRCFGLTSMFDRIYMEIVRWRRNCVYFLWKCKSCAVSWKLLLFENFHWSSWMRHIYGCTLSFFKTILRIFADVSVWPRCLVASIWKLCSEGEILFLFSENVSLVLYPENFYFLKFSHWKSSMRHIYGQPIPCCFSRQSSRFLPMFQFDHDV